MGSCSFSISTTSTMPLGRQTKVSVPIATSASYINRAGWTQGDSETIYTDGRAKSICLYYDGFERLVGKHLPSTTTCPAAGGYAVTYVYDQNHGTTLDTVVNRSRGLLTSVSNSGYNKTLFYNAGGLAAQRDGDHQRCAGLYDQLWL